MWNTVIYPILLTSYTYVPTYIFHTHICNLFLYYIHYIYIFSSNTSLRIKPIFKQVIRLENIYLLYSIFILHLVRKMVKKQILVYKFCGKKSLRIMTRPLHMVKNSLFSKPGVMAQIVNVPQKSLYLFPTLSPCVQMVEHTGGKGLLGRISMCAFAGDYRAPDPQSPSASSLADGLTMGYSLSQVKATAQGEHRLTPLKSR